MHSHGDFPLVFPAFSSMSINAMDFEDGMTERWIAVRERDRAARNRAAMTNGVKGIDRTKVEAGGRENESTAPININTNINVHCIESGEDGGEGGTDSANANDDVNDGGNTLWEQMTARENRDAARRAGMRAGDWQAERQLQETLRESRQEAEASDAASAPGGASISAEEGSFVDSGFHALATDTVEGEEEAASRPHTRPHGHRPASRNPHDTDSNGHDLSAVMHSINSAAATAATQASSSRRMREGATSASVAGRTVKSTQGAISGVPRQEEDEENEEDFGNVELVITQDGGIIPVAAGSATSDVSAAVSVPGSRSSLSMTKEVRREERVEVAPEEEDPSGTRKGRVERAGEGVGLVDDQEQEQEQEQEAPLPPDIMLTLPDDALHRVMLFLNPEDILECRFVSSRWEFPGHEAVFEGLCRRTYLAQSAKKLLNVKRWRSWQRMFKFRPRLRDTGLYSLKTSYFKKPVRDMSTDWTPGKILRVTYYRYFRFFGDGRVAYGLTHENPREFVRMIQEGSPKVIYGTYTIRKWEVHVEIPNPWSWVNFTLQLANGERGRFTHLVMLSHSSVPRNDLRAGRCHHTVKSTDLFTFRRVWQF